MAPASGTTIVAVNPDEREPRTGEPMTTNRREQAAALREQAAVEREEIATLERSLEERRDADTAGDLEAQARQLDLEQDRLDRADELRRQAEDVDADAATLEAEADTVAGRIREAAVRAARFEDQLATEVTERRRVLERQSEEAAAAGDTDALLAAERDTALLPMVEQRLQAQADEAAARAEQLTDEIARLDARAEHCHRYATQLRAQADADPLGPVNEDPDELRHLGDHSAGRRAALAALRQTPNLHQLDAAAIATLVEEHRQRAFRHSRLAHWAAPLDEIASRVAQVRDTARSEAAPWDGSLDWVDNGEGIRKPKILSRLRHELADMVDVYASRCRTNGSPGTSLSACRQLAVGISFRYAAEIEQAAAAAADEIAKERQLLEAAVARERA